jgi:hypothetical protein
VIKCYGLHFAHVNPVELNWCVEVEADHGLFFNRLVRFGFDDDSLGYEAAWAWAARARGRPSLLQPAHQKQYDDDDDHQPQPAAWPVAPISAVRPTRDGTNQHRDQHNQQYGSEHVSSFGVVIACLAVMVAYTLVDNRDLNVKRI